MHAHTLYKFVVRLAVYDNKEREIKLSFTQEGSYISPICSEINFETNRSMNDIFFQNLRSSLVKEYEDRRTESAFT
jgi:hypothetical protein